jgi:hypothetical protein
VSGRWLCASARHCCGSAVGTYAGTLRCHLILLPGNPRGDHVIARIWYRWRLPMTISIRLGVPQLTPVTLE